MVYYITCSIALLLFFTILGIRLYTDYRNIHDKWYRILFCIILAIIFKNSWNLLFCGLEYEDAYAFSFLAREFAKGIYTSSFLSEGIGIGSINTPVLMQTYGGHFITYSVLLSYPIKLFGFSLSLVGIMTTIINFLVLLILSVFIKTNDRFCWAIAPTIYCVAPIINVFGNTFLCEPFSSFIVVSFIYFFYRHIENDGSFLAVVISLFLAILTKRENLALIVLPFSYYGLLALRDNSILKKAIVRVLIIVCVCIVYFTIIQNVFNIESTESEDIGGATFSFLYFIRLAPTFISSLLNPSFFGVTIYILLFFSIAYFSKRNNNIFIVSLWVLWLAYFVSYTMHYRGYFFIQEQTISEFETFRYLNNFYCIVPIIIASIFIEIGVSKQLYYLIAILLIATIIPTIHLRKTFNEDEYRLRFQVPEETLNLINNDSSGEKTPVVVTSKILIFQNIGTENLFVGDIIYIDKLDYSNKCFKYYLLCRIDEFEYLKKRYGVTVDLTKWFFYANVSNGYILYRYDN